MTNPHDGMISFQRALLEGSIDVYPVPNHSDLFAHLDEPEPGLRRFTYVRLTEDHRTVLAFVSFVMNGFVDGYPCAAAGYAVPDAFRGHGRAKKILKDAIHDLVFQAGRNGLDVLYIEAVIDMSNIASQRVAESVMTGAERDEITDSLSGRLAIRYTSRFETLASRYEID